MRTVITALVIGMATLGGAWAEPVHGIATHGKPKYPAGFDHFDYADPKAPKGGELRMSATGSFDSLNPFILKGVAGAGVTYVFDTLLVSSSDEAASNYGLIAETIDIAPDKASVTYNLRPQARFQDGTPVTPADVVFSFETLVAKGNPMYRSYWADVTKVEATGPNAVTFRFRDGENAELPQVLGSLPILSKAYYDKVPFDQTTLTPPMGSGPYKIARVDAGRSITYERDPNYWGRDIPVNRGRFNFDTIRYDYYRDDQIALEAFKSGAFDFRVETSAKNWATAYDAPSVTSGEIKRRFAKRETPSGMQGFFFNTRRPLFQDRRVRQAIGYAFDFEWSNKTLFFGEYTRTTSYFDNSELAAKGLPSPAERALLEPLKDKLPPEVLTQEFKLPLYDGSGNIRDGLRAALALLKDAGWTVKNNQLTNDKGEIFKFEILDDDQRFERIIQPFIRNLERLGIQASLRIIDPGQYQHRTDEFDFDMTVGLIPQSMSPGNEQREFFGSAAARIHGSRNLAGLADPAVDALIEKVVYAGSREDLVTATKALDRALLWQYLEVPNFYKGGYNIAYWDAFGEPKEVGKYGFEITAWWHDPARAAALKLRRRGQ